MWSVVKIVWSYIFNVVVFFLRISVVQIAKRFNAFPQNLLQKNANPTQDKYLIEQDDTAESLVQRLDVSPWTAEPYHLQQVHQLLQQAEKYLLFLISVGKEYHEDACLDAQVDLFETVIQGCVRMLESEPDSAPENRGDWKIVIMVADTLQAYNHCTEETLEAEQVRWHQKGLAYVERNRARFQRLIAAGYSQRGQQVIQVNLQFRHWDETVHLCMPEFERHYDILNRAYLDTAAETRLTDAIKAKGFSYLERNASGKSEVDPLLPKYNRRYILEELVILYKMDLFKLFFKSETSPPLFLVYPGAEENAFIEARQFFKSSDRVNWLGLNARENHPRVMPALLGQSETVESKTTQYEWVRRATLGLAQRTAKTALAKTVIPTQEINITRTSYHRDIHALWQTTSIIVCYGLGGVGKSHLASDYLKQNKHDYTRQIWTSQSNIQTIYRALAEEHGLIAEKAKQKEVTEAVKLFLEENPGWILVIDNVQEGKAIQAFLPKKGGRVLITTRQKNLAVENSQALEIDVMTQPESCELLAAYVGQDDSEFPLIAKRLGFLPLALEQAAAYLEKYRVSVTDYLALYEEQDQTFWTGKRKLQTTTSNKAVAVTWQINIMAIKRTFRGNDKVIDALLLACALMYASRIPVATLEKWYASQPENSPNLADVIQQLREHCLVKGDGFINIHEVVQDVVRLVSQDDPTLVQDTSSTLVNAVSSSKAPAELNDLLPHMFAMTAHLDEVSRDMAILRNQIASSLIYNNPELAEQYSEKSIGYVISREFGNDDLFFENMYTYIVIKMTLKQDEIVRLILSSSRFQIHLDAEWCKRYAPPVQKRILWIINMWGIYHHCRGEFHQSLKFIEAGLQITKDLMPTYPSLYLDFMALSAQSARGLGQTDVFPKLWTSFLEIYAPNVFPESSLARFFDCYASFYVRIGKLALSDLFRSITADLVPEDNTPLKIRIYFEKAKVYIEQGFRRRAISLLSEINALLSKQFKTTKFRALRTVSELANLVSQDKREQFKSIIPEHLDLDALRFYPHHEKLRILVLVTQFHLKNRQFEIAKECLRSCMENHSDSLSAKERGVIQGMFFAASIGQSSERLGALLIEYANRDSLLIDPDNDEHILNAILNGVGNEFEIPATVDSRPLNQQKRPHSRSTLMRYFHIRNHILKYRFSLDKQHSQRAYACQQLRQINPAASDTVTLEKIQRVERACLGINSSLDSYPVVCADPLVNYYRAQLAVHSGIVDHKQTRILPLQVLDHPESLGEVNIHIQCTSTDYLNALTATLGDESEFTVAMMSHASIYRYVLKRLIEKYQTASMQDVMIAIRYQAKAFNIHFIALPITGLENLSAFFYDCHLALYLSGLSDSFKIGAIEGLSKRSPLFNDHSRSPFATFFKAATPDASASEQRDDPLVTRSP